jgi:hypothetical protein
MKSSCLKKVDKTSWRSPKNNHVRRKAWKAGLPSRSGLVRNRNQADLASLVNYLVARFVTDE